MLVKLFSRGTGKGRGPVQYCCDAVVPAFDLETRRRIRGEFVIVIEQCQPLARGQLERRV